MNHRHLATALALTMIAAPIRGAELLLWGKADAMAVPVSITELLATGNRFGGWSVSVIGVLEYSGDKDLLFSSVETYSNSDTASALGIRLDDAVEAGLSRHALRQADGKFVQIEGRFRPYQRYQLKEFQVRIGVPVAGVIESVTYIEEIERRR